MEAVLLAHELETHHRQLTRLHAFCSLEIGTSLLMANRLSLRISGDDWGKLRNLLFTSDGCENAAALLCGQSFNDHEDKLLVREIIGVSSDQYIDRQTYHLEVAPHFYNSVIDRCLRDHLVPVICHSHPFDGPARYS